MTASALVIAGFSSSGAGGVPVDVKTLSALGVYPAAAVTALVSSGSSPRVHLVPPEEVLQQARSAAAALGENLGAVKLGFLGSAPVVRAVGQFLGQLKSELPDLRVVVDPVLFFKSGAVVDDRTAAADQIRTHLLPFADFVTPNLAEAAALVDTPEITDVSQMRSAAQQLAESRPGLHVLVKGGMRLAGQQAADCYASGAAAAAAGAGSVRTELWTEPKIGSRPVNGTGCTLAAAITGFLARGVDPRQAALRARQLVRQQLRAPLQLGNGALALSGVATT